jgi:subtilisin family serine protease
MQTCISAFVHSCVPAFPRLGMVTFAAPALAAALLHPAPANWGLTRVGKVATDGSPVRISDGTGVGIYIIGTGVNSHHEDFIGSDGKSRVSYVGDFCTGERRSGTRELDANDGFDGHDTHVASYAAGRLSGVATNARIYSLRTTWQRDDSNAVDGGEFCRRGSDTDVAVAAAIDWIRLHGREEHGAGPAVVNYSGGRGNAGVRRAILEATDAGYLFTLSGNTGGAVEINWGSCDADRSIPCVPRQALVVGGTTEGDTPLGTGYGGLLGLYAPAAGLYGAGKESNTRLTIPEQQCSPPCSAGDSFAAPWVAGAAAVFLQNHPMAKPAQVRDEILRRAAPVAGLSGKMLALLHS